MLVQNVGMSPSVRTVSIVKLKSDLPEILQAVRRGEQVIVTKHGRRVALLTDIPPELRPPPQENENSVFEEILNPAWLRDILRS
jgi:prevent-host-death family protein